MIMSHHLQQSKAVGGNYTKLTIKKSSVSCFYMKNHKIWYSFCVWMNLDATVCLSILPVRRTYWYVFKIRQCPTLYPNIV